MSAHAGRSKPRVTLPPVLGIAFVGAGEGSESLRLVMESTLRESMRRTQGVVYGIATAGSVDGLLFAEACVAVHLPLQLLLPASLEALIEVSPESIGKRLRSVSAEALSVEPIGSQEVFADSFYECCNTAVQRAGLVLFVPETTPELREFAARLGRVTCLLTSDASSAEPILEGLTVRHDAELNFLNSLPDPVHMLDSPGSASELVEAWFSKVDSFATAQAPRAKRLASLPLFYTAIAAVLSGVASKSSLGKGWIAVSAVIGAFAALLPTLLRVDHRQAIWARTRIAAEVTRSVIATWDAPQGNELFGAELGSELRATLMSLRFLRLRGARERKVSLDAFKQAYLTDRIDDQRRYYARHAARADAEHKRYQLIARVAIAMAVLVALAWGLGMLGLPGFQAMAQFRFFGLAVSLFFQCATIAGALEFVHDSGRRQRRYWELHGWLVNWEIQLAAARSPSTVWDVVSQVERALIAEILEWRSLARNTKLAGK